MVQIYSLATLRGEESDEEANNLDHQFREAEHQARQLDAGCDVMDLSPYFPEPSVEQIEGRSEEEILADLQEGWDRRYGCRH